MTERRMLEPEEVAACERARERINQDLEHNRWLLKHAELMLSDGLQANYNRGIREYKDKAKAANDDILSAEASLALIKEQLENGVEIKEHTITSETQAEDA